MRQPPTKERPDMEQVIDPKDLNPAHFPPTDENGEPLEYRSCSYCGDIYDQHDVHHQGSRCATAERHLGR